MMKGACDRVITGSSSTKDLNTGLAGPEDFIFMFYWGDTKGPSDRTHDQKAA